MSARRLGTILIIAGIVVCAAALAWWMTFYSAILQELARAPGAPASSNGVMDFFNCFYSGRDVCGLIAGSARMLGRTPYEPMLLWAGLAALVGGIVIRLAARPGSGRA